VRSYRDKKQGSKFQEPVSSFAQSAEQNSREEIEEHFKEIYLFKNRELYFRMIEIGIMFNSFYMALWVTNIITLVNEIHWSNFAEKFFFQISFIVPIVLTFATLPLTTETCSVIEAFMELNFPVIHEVLEDTIEATKIINDLRLHCLTTFDKLKVSEDQQMHNPWFQRLRELEKEVNELEDLILSKYEEIDHLHVLLRSLETAISYQNRRSSHASFLRTPFDNDKSISPGKADSMTQRTMNRTKSVVSGWLKSDDNTANDKIKEMHVHLEEIQEEIEELNKTRHNKVHEMEKIRNLIDSKDQVERKEVSEVVLYIGNFLCLNNFYSIYCSSSLNCLKKLMLMAMV
jgi:predicted  nucleic acid-binding Zn-ribbon protein